MRDYFLSSEFKDIIKWDSHRLNSCVVEGFHRDTKKSIRNTAHCQTKVLKSKQIRLVTNADIAEARFFLEAIHSRSHIYPRILISRPVLLCKLDKFFVDHNISVKVFFFGLRMQEDSQILSSLTVASFRSSSNTTKTLENLLRSRISKSK